MPDSFCELVDNIDPTTEDPFTVRPLLVKKNHQSRL